MARNFRPRVSYTADAGFLNRLCRAVEEDKTRPATWKAELLTHLKAASILMINAPEQSVIPSPSIVLTLKKAPK